MDWRLRGIPAPLWRRVRDRAGDRLHEVLIGLLRAYADGAIDPLSDEGAADREATDADVRLSSAR